MRLISFFIAMASSDPSRRGLPSGYSTPSQHADGIQASVASSSDMSPVDPAVAAKVLPKKDKPSGPLKLKKSIAKNSRPKDSGKRALVSRPQPITS